MGIDQIKWQRTCCEWHGDYAEHGLIGGGIARIKRSPQRQGVLLLCRFGADGRAKDVDADGVPAYVEMSEAQAGAMLA